MFPGCGGAHRDAAPAAPRTYTLRTLAAFPAGYNSGPDHELALSAGGSTLYGTADRLGHSTVFSVPTAGGPVTTLAAFDTTRFQSATGYDPSSRLTLSVDGRTLYGTASEGGAYGFQFGTSGYGTVFSVPTGGGAITGLAPFNGANGAHPGGNLTLSADGGTLYGECGGGGGPDDASMQHFPQGGGTVFSLPAAGGPLSVVHAFTTAEGAYGPIGGLTPVGGTLYGLAGAVFSLPAGGGPLSILAPVSASVVGGPPPALMTYPSSTLTPGPGGVLYGTTTGGFPQRGQNLTGPGNVYAFSTRTRAFVVLAAFTADAGGQYPHGLHPQGDLALVGEVLYGTTTSGGSTAGGSRGVGTVYSLPAGGGPITTLHTFTAADGVGGPIAGLTPGPGGVFYGATNTTNSGSPGTDHGTVFVLTPDHLP